MNIKICVAILSTFALPALAADPGWQPFTGTVITGAYANYDYGFSVVIPETLQGFMATAPSSNHGVCIELGEDRPLCVTVQMNTLQYASGRAALAAWLAMDHAAGARVSSVVLDHHPAARADYRRDGKRIVAIERIRPQAASDAFEEQIYLETDDAHVRQDLASLKVVVTSFHEFPVPPLTPAAMEARRAPPAPPTTPATPPAASP